MIEKLKTVEELLGDTFANLLERYDGNCSAIARAANLEAKRRKKDFKISGRALRFRKEDLLTTTKVELSPALSRSAKQISTEQTKAIYNEIADTLNELSKPIIYRPFPSAEATGTESVVVLLSDWHFGKVCKREGRTLYNTNIAQRRLERFRERLDELLAQYIDIEEHQIDDLHLLILGDIVDSEIVYESQAHFIEKPVIDQITDAAACLLSLIWSQMSRFENVFVHTVSGNHGITERMHPASNWDNVVYMMCQMATKDLTNIHWDISQDDFNVAKIRKYRFLLRHGRDLPKGENTPSYRSKMGGWYSIHSFDAVAVAHWHHAKIGNWNGHKVFYNGSLISGDDLTERLAFADEPCQIVFGVSDTRPCTFVYFVDLKD